MPRYDHLQILRAVAASLVVLNHAIWSLQITGDQVGPFGLASSFLGLVGVDAFFLLSGLIMTIQTYNSFGQPAKALVFAWRRIIRIVPLYWIATLLLVVIDTLYHIGPERLTRITILSLCFLPNYSLSDTRMFPLLESGWTLNFEMAFYLLFTFALLLRRRFGLVVLLTVPEIIVFLGVVYPVPMNQAPIAMLSFYMQSRFVLLSYGVFMGILLYEIKRLSEISLPFSPALLLFLPFLLMIVSPRFLTNAWNWQNVLDFVIAIVALCLMVPNGPPNVFNRSLIFVGDASYSTYLSHSFVLLFLAQPIHQLCARLHLAATPVVLISVVCLIVCTLVGLLVHVLIERPITRALRSIPFERFAESWFTQRQTAKV